MPNWAFNVLIMDDAVSQLRKKHAGFCLQKIKPMPSELKQTYHGMGSLEVEQKSKDLIAKYGSDDWYDWCKKNWGTKWDISDFKEQETGQSVSFKTAWTSPVAALKELCLQLKQDFEVVFRIEGGDEVFLDEYSYDESSNTVEVARTEIGTVSFIDDDVIQNYEVVIDYYEDYEDYKQYNDLM